MIKVSALLLLLFSAFNAFLNYIFLFFCFNFFLRFCWFIAGRSRRQQYGVFESDWIRLWFCGIGGLLFVSFLSSFSYPFLSFFSVTSFNVFIRIYFPPYCFYFRLLPNRPLPPLSLPLSFPLSLLFPLLLILNVK